MKKYTALLALIISMALPCHAERSATSTTPVSVPAGLPQLTSEAKLRAEALEQAIPGWANVQVGSASSIKGSTPLAISWDHAPKSSSDLGGIIDKFINTQQIGLINDSDEVYIFVTIRNSEGDPLWYGWGSSTPQEVEKPGGKFLPETILNYSLADSPTKVGRGVAKARFYGTDGGGTEFSRNIDVANGKLYFPSLYAGKGILVLYDKSGNVLAEYDLTKGGQVQQPTKLTPWVESNFANVWSYQDPGKISQTVYSSGGEGSNPTFEVVLSVELKKLPISVQTSEGVTAIGYSYKKLGDETWSETNSPSEIGPIGAGTYYIVPKWNPDEFREVPLKPHPDNGGGEYGGTAG